MYLDLWTFEACSSERSSMGFGYGNIPRYSLSRFKEFRWATDGLGNSCIICIATLVSPFDRDLVVNTVCVCVFVGFVLRVFSFACALWHLTLWGKGRVWYIVACKWDCWYCAVRRGKYITLFQLCYTCKGCSTGCGCIVCLACCLGNHYTVDLDTKYQVE